MSIGEWFAIGVGGAAALWWWRYCVQWAIWEWEAPDNAYGEDSPFAGLMTGTIIFIGSPLWVPVVGAQKIHAARTSRRAWRSISGTANTALVHAFPRRGGRVG